MTGYVVRRSALSLALLTALLAAGGTVLVLLGAPLWVPLAVSLGVVVGQWALSPLLVQWLVPAYELRYREDGYDTVGYPRAEALAAIVEHRCREAGLRPVRLGVVDDGTPNAFTFGRTRRDARIYVTRGLLDRLDERELDAVVCHEIGHVRQNDVLVMALVSTVPLVLYYAHLALRESRDQNTVVPALVSYAAFLVSQLAVLAFGRARELGADRYSCRVTGNGDALCSALVAIGYAMGRVDADRAARAREIRAGKDGDAKSALRKEQARHRRVRAAGMLGIADDRQGATVLAAAERGLEPREVVGALRWETCNPWARFAQLTSTHPLVVRRIAALEDSGLPGAPRNWSAREVAASCEGPDLARARRRFWPELLVRFAPLAALVVGLVAWSRDDLLLIAQSATVLGLALVVRNAVQRPPGTGHAVERVTELLPRIDAGPVTGLPVRIQGRVIGRGMPGYLLSPDLVVQDESGFVPVLYRQPWPFARSIFGLLRVPDLLDQDVVVRGWYRRDPAPFVELRRLDAAGSPPVRGWTWVAGYLLGTGLALAGAAGWLLLGG